MIANFHTHTQRCRHAVGADEDYVNCAVQGGLQILGFSDHTPYWFPDGYYSHFRMFPEELERYCASVEQLKAQYAGQLQIHLGVEAEYYPAYFDELLARLRDTPVEYMILGQHFVGSEIGEPYSGRATDSQEVLARYCDQVIDAMHTGLFTYLAHPDLLFFVGEDAVYRAHMRRLCRAARECGMLLEINGVGIRSGRNYPDDRFWEIAGEEGCKCILGCDAHASEHLCDVQWERQAVELAVRCGLQIVQTAPLRPIR